MTFLEEFKQALRHQRVLMKHRPDRWPFRALIYLIWTLGFGSFFALISGLQRRNLGTSTWWTEQVPSNLVMSLCVTLAFFIGYRGFERLAPQRWLDTIMGWRDWRSGLFFSGLSISLALVGVIVGIFVIDAIWGIGRPVLGLLMEPVFWRQFLIISAIISVLLTWRYRMRWKQEMLQARVTEAQLKLLETQLEPHMMFNTLANLRVLIGMDPPRAQAMLDHLIAYLRATLSASRTDGASGRHTLATEFERLNDFLALMAIRMGPRLRVQLDLPDALRSHPVPPLLLQPLVENALKHGLRPRDEGGTLQVQAGKPCPECGNATMIHKDGCDFCTACGYVGQCG